MRAATTQASSTRIRIFLKTNLFYSYKKYSRPYEDAATFKLRYSNFDKRKQTEKKCLCVFPKDPCACSLRYVVNRCRDVSVFEKLRFHPSTRQHESGVFKKIHSGARFQKASFLMTETLSACGCKPKTDKKRCVFKNIQICVNRTSK